MINKFKNQSLSKDKTEKIKGGGDTKKPGPIIIVDTTEI